MLDRHTTVFPAGMTWAPALGLLVLPDGTTVAPGQTIAVSGTDVKPSVAKGVVFDQNLQTSCPSTPEVCVLSRATTGQSWPDRSTPTRSGAARHLWHTCGMIVAWPRSG